MSKGTQRTLHEKLELHAKYGVDDDWTVGYLAAMSDALHLIVREDGVNHTGCAAFDRDVKAVAESRGSES